MRFPTDEELLSQFKLYLGQRLKQLEYICTIYRDNKDKKNELAAVKKKVMKIDKSRLV